MSELLLLFLSGTVGFSSFFGQTFRFFLFLDSAIDVRGVQSDEEAQEIMKLIQKHSKDRQL